MRRGTEKAPWKSSPEIDPHPQETYEVRSRAHSSSPPGKCAFPLSSIRRTAHAPALKTILGKFRDSRLVEIAGTDATHAHLDSSDRSAGFDLDALEVRFKGTLHILNHMHTDTAGLLRQTFASNATAVGLRLPAHFADFAHVVPLSPAPPNKRSTGFYREIE